MNNARKLKALLGQQGIDALLLTTPENRFYATGFSSSAGIVIITSEKNYFFTDFRYIEAAKAIEEFEIVMTDRNKKYSTLINSTIEAHNIKRIGFEDLRMSVSEHKDLALKLEAELIGVGNSIFDARSSKESWELERMRAAQAIAEKALDEVLELIRPGLTENEIAAELIYRMLRNGAEDMSFNPIVVSGSNSSKPHGVPSDKRIESGS